MASKTAGTRRLNSYLVDRLNSLPRGGKARVAREVGVEQSTVHRWADPDQGIPEDERWPAIEDALGLERGTLDRIYSDSGSAPVIYQGPEVPVERVMNVDQVAEILMKSLSIDREEAERLIVHELVAEELRARRRSSGPA